MRVLNLAALVVVVIAGFADDWSGGWVAATCGWAVVVVAPWGSS